MRALRIEGGNTPPPLNNLFKKIKITPTEFFFFSFGFTVIDYELCASSVSKKKSQSILLTLGVIFLAILCCVIFFYNYYYGILGVGLVIARLHRIMRELLILHVHQSSDSDLS